MTWKQKLETVARDRVLWLVSVMSSLLDGEDTKLDVYHSNAYDMAEELDRLGVTYDAD